MKSSRGMTCCRRSARARRARIRPPSASPAACRRHRSECRSARRRARNSHSQLQTCAASSTTDLPARREARDQLGIHDAHAARNSSALALVAPKRLHEEVARDCGTIAAGSASRSAALFSGNALREVRRRKRAPPAQHAKARRNTRHNRIRRARGAASATCDRARSPGCRHTMRLLCEHARWRSRSTREPRRTARHRRLDTRHRRWNRLALPRRPAAVARVVVRARARPTEVAALARTLLSAPRPRAQRASAGRTCASAISSDARRCACCSARARRSRRPTSRSSAAPRPPAASPDCTALDFNVSHTRRHGAHRHRVAADAHRRRHRARATRRSTSTASRASSCRPREQAALAHARRRRAPARAPAAVDVQGGDEQGDRRRAVGAVPAHRRRARRRRCGLTPARRPTRPAAGACFPSTCPADLRHRRAVARRADDPVRRATSGARARVRLRRPSPAGLAYFHFFCSHSQSAGFSMIARSRHRA